MLTAMSSKTTKQDTTVTMYHLVTKEENIQKLNFTTIKYFCSLKDTTKRISKKTQSWEKCIPITYLITDFISGYVNNSPNIIIRSQINQL